MATTSPTTSAVPSAADSSMQRVASKRRSQRRMIYGFTFSYEELVEWGQQHFGETDDEEELQHYVRKSMGPLFARCYRLWRRTTKHIVTYYSGSRRHDEDWCLCLADNITRDTATPPPQELIDKIKEALEITRNPEWHRFYGDWRTFLFNCGTSSSSWCRFPAFLTKILSPKRGEKLVIGVFVCLSSSYSNFKQTQAHSWNVLPICR